MKDAEDEAFDEIAKKQGAWGGGYQAKRAMAADKLQEPVAWAVQGCAKMWRGEFAEIDAKAEAKRIGGTCVAYALYTTPPAAQPAQGPFGWYSAQEDEFMTHKIRKEHERLNSFTHMTGKFDLALYITPPQRPWVGLTDIDIAMAFDGVPQAFNDKLKFAQAVEAKLKEKNT